MQANVAPLEGAFGSNENALSDFLSHDGDTPKNIFDLASFINDTDSTKSVTSSTSNQQSHPETERKRPIGGKKVDLEAQKYIIDDPEDVHIDVETISENGSPPALEAGDLDSLLEQFEATEGQSSVLQPQVCSEDFNDCDKVKVDLVKEKVQVGAVEKGKNTVKKQEKCKKQAVLGE